jgi:uncharacterized damage-inducible protein DinB
MDARLAGSAQLFETSSYYLRQSVKGLDDEQLRQRVGKANSILWTLGHITVGRLRLLNILGETVDIPWTKVVGRGADEVTHALPDAAEVFARWDDAVRRLADRLQRVSEDELVAAARYNLPGSDGTMLGTINYFAFHEAYHTGQLAVIRKALNEALPRRTVDRLVGVGS